MTDQPKPVRSFPPNSIHLARTTHLIQYQLSQMADQKASILMAAAFVIFTITVGQAGDGDIPAPLIVLGTAAFVAALLSALAVLPSLAKPGAGPHSNLLFFSIFAQMDEDVFVDHFLDTLSTDESVYRAIGRDVYQNGRVLAGKKYRLLGYAYRVFLGGLIASFTMVAVSLF